MSGITTFLYNILAGITGFVGNYGVSIILFTMLIRLICVPFDYKSRKGMRRMAKFQPELAKLQKKYGDDKAKLQQKQAELMRREHYSPMSGCLPMLLTYPLMIAMFAAMRSIANEQVVMQAFRYLANEAQPILNSEKFLWIKNIWIVDSPFSPIAPLASTLSNNGITYDIWQKVYTGLSDVQLDAIAANLATVPGAVLDFTSKETLATSVNYIVAALQNVPAYTAAIATVPGWSRFSLILMTVALYQNFNGLMILPILAGVTQWIAVKLNPQANALETAPEQQKTTRTMNIVFLGISVWFCLTSNAGFSVYWVASNLIMALSNIIMNKIMDRQEAKEALKNPAPSYDDL